MKPTKGEARRWSSTRPGEIDLLSGFFNLKMKDKCNLNDGGFCPRNRCLSPSIGDFTQNT